MLALWLATSLVFVAIHLGPRAPVEDTAGDDPDLSTADEKQALEEKKAAFGLYRPLHVQYVDYLSSTFTFDFGESWSSRWVDESHRAEPITDVNRLVFGSYLHRTLWLWGWTAVLTALAAGALTLGIWRSPWDPDIPGATVGGALLRALPVVLLDDFVSELLANSDQLLFGFEWGTFLVDHSGVSGAPPLGALGAPQGFLVASKQTVPLAAVLALALLPSAVRLGQQVVQQAERAPRTTPVPTDRDDARRQLRRNSRRPSLSLLSMVTFNLSILFGGTLLIEVHNSTRGVGALFVEAVGHGDYTVVQALLFLATLSLVVARLIEAVAYVALAGVPADRDTRARHYWTGAAHRWDTWTDEGAPTERLAALRRATVTGFAGRVRSNPRPAVVWASAGVGLVALEAGAVLDVLALVPLVPPLPDLPTLLSRDLLPNMGYREPGTGWQETAFGLSPASAWTLRAALVYGYAGALTVWLASGYRIYRTAYRAADRTPTDAAIRRFRTHPWGVFGLAVVACVLVEGMFAPTLSPTPMAVAGTDHSVDRITVYNDQNDVVRQVGRSYANTQTESAGKAAENVGVWRYDQFDRFHPLGTTYGGSDQLRSLLGGVRGFFLGGGIGTAFLVGLSVISLCAGRSGVADAVVTSLAEVATVLPTVPFAFFFVDQFEAALGDGSLFGAWTGTIVMAAVLGVVLWPAVFRSLKAPTVGARTAGWTQAASSFEPSDLRRTVRHVLPRLVGQIAVYALLSTVGMAVAIATVGSLWGGTTGYLQGTLVGWGVSRMLFTVSWHTAAVPAVAGVVLVFAVLCLADGIRAATDPLDTKGLASPGEAAAAGGAG